MDKRITAALVLVVVLAGIGWYVGTKRPAPAPQAPQAAAPTPATPGPQGAGVPTTAELTDDERKVLTFSSDSANAAEKAAHLELVNRVAKEADEVNVASCALNPPVLKAHSDEPIVFRNTGEGPVTVASSWISATIDPGESHSVTLKGGGFYGYGCNSGSGGMPGIVQLVP